MDTIRYPFRFYYERADGALVFVYKRTALAAKRAYLKFGRSLESNNAKEYGWETYEPRRFRYLDGQRTAWLDTDSIVPVR